MVDVFRLIDSARSRGEAVTLRAVLRLPGPALRAVAGRPVRADGQTLDTQMQALLRLQSVANVPQVEMLPLPAGRALLTDQLQIVGGEQPIGEARDLALSGPAGDLSARLYVPRGQVGPSPLLLFLHGGGWVYGGLESHDAVCRYLAEQAGIRVLALDYRLAPEHPFPAALDDSFAAYTWMREHAVEVGGDPARLAVGGDSAGANLAIAVCLRARGEDVSQPSAQVLVCPGTDSTLRMRSHEMFEDGFSLSRAFLDRCQAAYVGPGTDPADPLVSPLQAEDLSGLASAYVVTAGFDPLRDEGEAFARRVAADGGTVELRRHAGLIHPFLNLIGVSSSARTATHELVRRLRDL